MTEPTAAPLDPTTLPDAATLLKDRSYLALLMMGAIVGIPVAVVSYFFLKIVAEAQQWIFTTLPDDLGFHNDPAWWPLIPLALCGLIVALAIHYLPGTAGHKPAEGFKTGGPVQPIELPGIIIASLATLSLGAVLGPEAPLIAIGSGMGVLAVRLIKKDAPAMAMVVIGAAGSFAAVSALLASPVVGAFLMLEVTGIGGPLLGVVLVPGLLASGVGALVFVGLDRWTGFGTFSLVIPNLPTFGTPTGAEILWAIAIGLLSAVVGTVIKRGGLFLQPIIERRMVLLMPLVGLAIGGSAAVFQLVTDRSATLVLFSGQDALPGLIEGAATWTAGALTLLCLCKGVAYAASLSSFRGGPTFPGMFIGAAGGMALSHLAGLPMIAGAAMGTGAMTVAMLNLPMTSLLLTAVFFGGDAVQLMPLIIIAVVVSYVASTYVAPVIPSEAPATTDAPPTGGQGGGAAAASSA